jgi:hypothetical protein
MMLPGLHNSPESRAAFVRLQLELETAPHGAISPNSSGVSVRRCVDVGANYGYYTLLMTGVCGPEGRVVACEPNPSWSRRTCRRTWH